MGNVKRVRRSPLFQNAPCFSIRSDISILLQVYIYPEQRAVILTCCFLSLLPCQKRHLANATEQEYRQNLTLRLFGEYELDISYTRMPHVTKTQTKQILQQSTKSNLFVRIWGLQLRLVLFLL